MQLDNEFMKRLERERVERASKRDKARQILIRELRAAGTKTVDVDFDGYGDSGGVGSIIYRPVLDGKKEVGDTPHEAPDWSEGTYKKIVRNYTFDELVEEVCYGILEEQHGGWEINEGSYGTFEIDVAKDSVALHFNERIASVESYEEEY